MEEYEDIELKCECGTTFVYSARDQKFFKEMGFTPPKRCHACRKEKKRKREQHEGRNY